MYCILLSAAIGVINDDDSLHMLPTVYKPSLSHSQAFQCSLALCNEDQSFDHDVWGRVSLATVHSLLV